jgi:magnesium transporter
VDGLFDLLERTGERIEDVEDRLVTKPNRSALAEVHHLRRETIEFRRHLWPMREAVAMLERGESSLISPETRIYLRDAYDHAIQAIDLAETCRDTLSGVLDLYLSSASWKLNEAMMELTVIATIFMPLSFIAGVYGMNFKDMPELSWRWGYPACWALMIGIAAWLIRRFWKKGWLGGGSDFRPRRRWSVGTPSFDADDDEEDPATEERKGPNPERSDGDAREA